MKKQAAAGPKAGLSVDQLIADAADVGGVKVVIAEVPGGPNDLRQMIDQLRRKAAPVAVLLANRQEEEKKVTLIAGLSRDLVERGLDAVAWVQGGVGGGRRRRRRPARHGPSRRQAAASNSPPPWKPPAARSRSCLQPADGWR